MPKAKNPETMITFLLDKSGSMGMIRDDTIGAFNTYIDTLKSEFEGDGGLGVRFTLLQFDSMSVDKTFDKLPIKDVVGLTTATFVPRGSTPLIDAAYKTIKAVEVAVASRPKTKVIICIQTDGHENCSHEHTWVELNALIKEKTALGWQFNFMGSSIDAYDQGARMGISAMNTVSYDAQNPGATRAIFASTAKMSADMSKGLRDDVSYSGAMRHSAKDKFANADLMAATPAPNKTKPAAVDDITV